MEALKQRIIDLENRLAKIESVGPRLTRIEKILRLWEPVIVHFSKQNVLMWFILLLAMTSIIMQLIK
jgi:hypothetical protein